MGINNAFGQIQEAEAFANPTKYAGAWTTQKDIATNTTYLAYNQANLNLGKEYYSGIDINLQGRTPTSWGRLDTRLAPPTCCATNVNSRPVASTSSRSA